MSTLPTRSHAAFVATIAAGMQGRTARFLNFATGGVFLALAEAYAGVALWLQKLILQVQSETRLATSRGADVDSYVADYGLTRLPAIPASGVVTFARFTAAPVTATIPVGAQVKTGDGSLVFLVTADSTIPTYDNGQAAYVVPPNVAQLSVPVTCTSLGSVGNVGKGAVSLIASEVKGLDTVVNGTAFDTGVDAESDAAVMARFRLFLASLSKATPNAVRYAIASLRQGLECTIVDGYDLDGTKDPGSFYVIVDDGTGNPPDSALEAARLAVDAVRAAGIKFSLFGPRLLSAYITGSISVRPGYEFPIVSVAVAEAISSYVNNLTLGEDLQWSRLYQVAYDSSAGIASVTNLQINGATSDVIATPRGVVRTNTVSFV